MRIYLDTCCLQRPFDDQTQPRIRVETEAVIAILSAVQAGDLILLTSEVLEFEIWRIPDEQRRREASAILALASERLVVTETNEASATALERPGISSMDALHVALASEAAADYFATTDDKLLKRLKALKVITCNPISLLDLLSEVTK